MIGRRLIAVMLLVLSAIIVRAEKPQKVRRDGFVVGIGDELPHFSYTTFGGDEADSDFLRSGVTLIQFAASWCTLSREQIKDTQLFAQEMAQYSDLNIVIFDLEDEAQDTTLFVDHCAQDGITLQTAFDASDRIYNLFAEPLGSVSRTIVSDRHGRIAYLSNTYSRRQFKKTKKKIRKMLVN